MDAGDRASVRIAGRGTLRQVRRELDQPGRTASTGPDPVSR